MKKNEILIILIPTFICIIAWIGFNIYHSSVTSTISNQEIMQIIPISPNFNTKVIDQLKKREKVEAYYQESTMSAVITPPTPTITSLQPLSSASATPQGVLR